MHRARTITRNPKVIWEESRRRPSLQSITTPQGAYLLQWGAPHLPPKLPFPLRQSSLPSNTSIPQPTPLTTPNDIQIQSAVLPQYILRTDRQTDTGARRQLCSNSRLRSIDRIASDARLMCRADRGTTRVTSPENVFWLVNSSDDSLVWGQTFTRVEMFIDGESGDFDNYNSIIVSELELRALSRYARPGISHVCPMSIRLSITLAGCDRIVPQKVEIGT